MSLNLDFFKRKTNIKAKVLAHSINIHGVEMVTLEIEYPRYILAELNTHKGLEKNSSSSRAIPFNAMIGNIQENMAMPLYWGKNISGMQAKEELDHETVDLAKKAWEEAYGSVLDHAFWLNDHAKLHKQTINRLTEPFQMMKTVITGTDWDNFFNLRIHPDAQPEFCMLAYKILMAIKESRKNKNAIYLQKGEWHLPYVSRYRVQTGRGKGQLEYYLGEINTDTYQVLSLEDAIKISASCTAQTSYRKNDETLEKAEKVFNMLIGADVLHASPFGHLGTPIEQYEERNHSFDPETWDAGITHVNRKGQLCSANLRTYIQYRHLIENNTCWDFNFEERMKLFT